MGKRCKTCDGPTVNGRSYCSDECKRKNGVGVCVICGADCDRKYCSKECCRSAEYRKRKIARLRESRRPLKTVGQYLCKSCGNFVIYEPCRICLAKEARDAAKEISRNQSSQSVID